jgi:hypothetical protein
MESGELDLKAWGSGLAPQAQLHFNDELILKNQYVPVVGLFNEGSKVAAYRCTACHLICFQYS